MTEGFIVGALVLVVAWMLFRGGAGRLGIVAAITVGVLVAPTLRGIVGTGINLTQTGGNAVSNVGNSAR